MSVLNIYEVFRMNSPAERYFWACYQLFVAFSSIVGDSLILLVSNKKDSFQLNSFLVTVMRHIAVCDITISITLILPSTMSLIADKWVLGDTLCYATPYLTGFFFPTNMSLICVLTTGKFLLLTQPHWAKNLSIKSGHIVCGIMWATSLANPCLMYVLGRADVSFDYRTYACIYGWNASLWVKVKPVMFVMIAVVPNAVVLLTTIPTLKYLVVARRSAKRAGGSVPWQGALTVFLTAAVYCLSTLPGTAYLIGAPFAIKDQTSEHPYHFHLLYRYGIFIAMINIASNFFIYSLTITSFRRYLCSKIVGIGSFQKPRPQQVMMNNL